MVVILGEKAEGKIDVIPISFFGGTLKDIIMSIAQQIAMRDQNNDNNFNPKLVSELMGIQDKVFKMICMASSNGSSLFDNVKIYRHDDTKVRYRGI